MRKVLAVSALVVAMVAGARLAPMVMDSSYLSIMGKTHSTNIYQANASSGDDFFQVIINYIIKYIINNALGSGVESRIGQNEKILQGKKEAAQAGINYMAAQKTSENVANATGEFTPHGTKRACEVVVGQEAASNAGLSSHISKKAFMANATIRHGNVNNTNEEMDRQLNKYKTRYCSFDSVVADRCQDIGKNPDANIVATSILAPGEFEDGLGGDELQAARDFAEMVSDPAPIENLPSVLEKTPGGNRYLQERLQYQALMSLGNAGLSQIIGNRVAGKPEEIARTSN